MCIEIKLIGQVFCCVAVYVAGCKSYCFVPAGKAFEDQPRVENHYEPIANIFPSRVTATATATASIIDTSSSFTPPPTITTTPSKPDLPPKPPGLLKMGEPGQPPRRVKALYNFKGANNDEVIFSSFSLTLYF